MIIKFGSKSIAQSLINLLRKEGAEYEYKEFFIDPCDRNDWNYEVKSCSILCDKMILAFVLGLNEAKPGTKNDSFELIER